MTLLITIRVNVTKMFLSFFPYCFFTVRGENFSSVAKFPPCTFLPLSAFPGSEDTGAAAGSGPGPPPPPLLPDHSFGETKQSIGVAFTRFAI